jgi:hypothetical protein
LIFSDVDDRKGSVRVQRGDWNRLRSGFDWPP